jgi:DNA-binding CsgD family transcriptional regulator
MHLCLDDFLIGRWSESEELADEGIALCQKHGFAFFEWYFLYNKALVAAGCGRYDEAAALADDMTQWAAPRGVRSAELWAHHPRTLIALGNGEYDAAFRHASSLSPAGTLASHVPHALWVMFDLIESAMRTGRQTDAAAHVAAMHEAGIASISPRMARLQSAANALVADDASAVELFDAALATPRTERWRYDEARIRLAYGERLRRTKATLPARAQLLAAREAFEAMGALPWVERTLVELRATGERVQRITQPGTGTLTAQEREIALLAASGLSNKQIAERLFLSHRTVGAHLYRIFPKLGVTSRAALRDALSAQLIGD